MRRLLFGTLLLGMVCTLCWAGILARDTRAQTPAEVREQAGEAAAPEARDQSPPNTQEPVQEQEEEQAVPERPDAPETPEEQVCGVRTGK